MHDKEFRIVLLCGNSRSSRIMYHGLARDHVVAAVILEGRPPAKQTIARRIKRLGALRVFGQLLFIACTKLASGFTSSRVRQLLSDYGLSEAEIPGAVVRGVESANSEATIKLLRDLRPDVVVVNGTRILSAAVLASVDAPFINTHMGITPRYRGVHGGYWALAKEDPQNCGVTVHLVDTGIDTGGVLYQDTITVQGDDNFTTYPIHQIAKAIPLMNAAIDDARQRRLITKTGVLPSRLWSHPTLFEYLRYRIRLGVK